MKNILRIIRGDTRRICSNVVGIVIIMGLCVVPCLYAWFNIFSNWDPYGTDSTSRIRVAVYSMDKGADILGMHLNVGDKVIEALESNDQIGWVFANSRSEALKRVYSGDCYAALIVPEDFSKDFVSFMSLKFEHPQLLYYENGKKNAIAPKITGQAKNSVQQQVNATFLSTVVSIAAEGVEVLEANGIDVVEVIEDLSDKMVELSDKLNDADKTMDSLANLTNASRTMLNASGSLVGNIAATVNKTGDLATEVGGNLHASAPSIREDMRTVSKNIEGTAKNVEQFYYDLDEMLDEDGTLIDVVEQDIESRQTTARELKDEANQMADYFEYIRPGLALQMRLAARHFGDIEERMGVLLDDDPDNPDSLEAKREAVVASLDDLNQANQALSAAAEDTAVAMGTAVADVLNGAGAAAEDMAALLDTVGGNTANVSAQLYSLASMVGTMETSVYTAKDAIAKTQVKLGELSEFLDALAQSEFLQETLDLLRNGPDVLDSRVASPIRVSEETLFPANYGSQMAPFYTVLAQWVGALFCAVLLKTRMREEDKPPRMKMYQHFFGRYGLYFFVGTVQALVTSLGDLLYVCIDCAHPVLFVLAAVMTGICFTMINYVLAFTLGDAGLAVSVIIMVLQVGGSGGTYPVDVVPKEFRFLYPYMPFKFAMNSMREAISGLYGNYYIWNIGIMALIVLGCIVLAFLIYRPGKWLNDILLKAKAKTGIMS